MTTMSLGGTKPPVRSQPARPSSAEAVGTKMATRAERSSRTLAKVFNLPNRLTSLRLFLSLILFCILAWEQYLWSLVLFIIAAGTDWLDGYYARKYGQVTTLGRILDPFADKVIVCGTFIFLLAAPAMADVRYGLRAWMVVVIVGRELLVTALRSFIEDRGSDFSAKVAGKLKMLVQCIAAGVCLFYLHYAQPGATVAVVGWLKLLLVVSVWSAVVLTVYSGVGYVVAAVRLLRQ
jgi:CDP-diacylglycerol--glycerol-3-phosphate 3-phosphatidyltransferase